MKLNLDDPAIRDMAWRNHVPEERWSVAGHLLLVCCETCGHDWPCLTYKQLVASTGDRT